MRKYGTYFSKNYIIFRNDLKDYLSKKELISFIYNSKNKLSEDKFDNLDLSHLTPISLYIIASSKMQTN